MRNVFRLLLSGNEAEGAAGLTFSVAATPRKSRELHSLSARHSAHETDPCFASISFPAHLAACGDMSARRRARAARVCPGLHRRRSREVRRGAGFELWLA